MLAEFLAWSQSVINIFGYLGLFVISIIGNASVIFPVPVFVLVFAAGAVLNPWLVALSAAVGATIGEVTAYGVGLGSEKLLEKRYGKWFAKAKKWFAKAKKWFESHSPFLIIVLFAASPLPYDVIGIVSGLARYNIKKFMLATLTGKIILNLYIAWAGFFGIRWVLGLFGG